LGVTARYLEGFACLYNVKHHFRGGIDIFERGCFSDSLRRFNDVMYGIDHEFHKPKLGKQCNGSLELADTDVGLAFRLKLEDGHLEKLEGRDQVSCAYIVHEQEFRGGVRHIKRAAIFEISSVYIGAMTTTHAVVVDANKIGKLADDAKRGFASESAATAFIRALKRLQ
jgi:HK97 family phage prohead protease